MARIAKYQTALHMALERGRRQFASRSALIDVRQHASVSCCFPLLLVLGLDKLLHKSEIMLRITEMLISVNENERKRTIQRMVLKKVPLKYSSRYLNKFPIEQKSSPHREVHLGLRSFRRENWH
jgi:hypothetical protein